MPTLASPSRFPSPLYAFAHDAAFQGEPWKMDHYEDDDVEHVLDLKVMGYVHGEDWGEPSDTTESVFAALDVGAA